MKTRRFHAVSLAFLSLALGLAPAHAAAPMTYLQSYGDKQAPVEALTWGSLAVSIAVMVIIGTLLIAAIFRRRPPMMADRNGRLPLATGGGGLSWIVVGVAISTVVLLGIFVWNVAVLAKVASPGRKTAFTIEVTGHQWWWEVHYLNDDPSQSFFTANEIHIPVGAPVEVRLKGADVIHSFWVPALTGKTDTIPGQTNITWLEANEPGTYRGQCTEYCGLEHAKMALQLVAQQPQDFDAWRRNQLAPAAVSDPQQMRGELQFMVHCGSCHTVRGTNAGGALGPDLSHLMTRKTIAAGLVPNTPGNLSGWIADPQQLKPGALMPQVPLSGTELTDIRSFLESLS